MNLNEAIIKVLEKSKISNQLELLGAVEKIGFAVNQSTLSRALKRLQITKADGFYTLPQIRKPKSDYFDFLRIIPSGDAMLVVKTSPGSASRVAYHIDGQSIKGIAGTISGDDTIFVAIENKNFKDTVTTAILELFNT